MAGSMGLLPCHRHSIFQSLSSAFTDINNDLGLPGLYSLVSPPNTIRPQIGRSSNHNGSHTSKLPTNPSGIHENSNLGRGMAPSTSL
jgi:hypothetical protein